MKHIIKVKLIDEEKYYLLKFCDIRFISTDEIEDKKCIKIRLYDDKYIFTDDFTIDQFDDIWNMYFKCINK